MLILLSPAKTLDLESQHKIKEQDCTLPDFLEQSEILIKKLKKLSRPKVGELMGISPKLADLNYQRFQDWSVDFNAKNARPALLTFKGDVYQGLEAETFKKADFNFAQKHLRILSGLYGLLRPLDLMQAYRLEMGTKFAVNAKTKNLYEFWDNQLTENINAELSKHKKPLLVNLASNEYFKAVKAKNIDAEIISPAFKDMKNGQYKVIAFFAKKARGAMAKHLICNRIKDKAGINSFEWEGYIYNKDLSKDNAPVFTRG